MPVLKRDELPAAMGAHDVHTILGPAASFEGKLVFDGAVRVDGNFKGEIRTSDRLVVGEGARVEATIEVGTIVITGEVIGDVTAKQAVEIHKPGKLRGNITTPNLMIENGVVFEGSCKMDEASLGRVGAKVTLLKDDAKTIS